MFKRTVTGIQDFKIKINDNAQKPVISTGYNSNSLKCLYTNATSFEKNKLNEVIAEIEISSPDIIFITETWWNDTSAAIIPGYNLYRRDRMNSRGGGVCIYVNDLIDSFEVNNEPYNNKNIEQIRCTIKMSNECILCGCIYRPGSDDLVNFQNVINSIKESYNYFSKTKIYTEVLICGDFNFPSLNSIWNSCYESVCIGEKERQFLECIEELFTTSPFRISSLVHMDPLGKTKRGHHVLNFNFNYQLHNRKNESITTKRVYMKGNYHEFSKYLNKFNWSHEFTGLNVDQCYESFIRTIEYGCKDFIPSFNQKTTESKRSLWMNKELKHEIRLKQSKKNPKQVYAYINSKLKAKDHIRAISIENNEISTDSQVIANQLNRFFNSVFINESLTNMPTCENITEKICPTPLFNGKILKNDY
nr:uncharacterized protein LOC101237182 [Hydra vulgaris]